MKKTMLTLAGLFMIGVAVNAQSDSTTSTVPDNYSQMSQPEPSGTSQQPTNPDRVRVQANDLPASMRQTLSGTQYKGWESAPIYRNNSTNQYSFDLSNNGATKTYTFDQSGKPVVGSTSSVSSSTSTTTDNSGTYSSKNTSTKSSTTGGSKNSSTKVHKSSAKKSSSPGSSSSSTTTTNSSSSSTTGSTPVTK
jgi:trimeric autotransporter adhesin